MPKPTACKYCGRSKDLTWRSLGGGKWRIFETDASGAPIQMHNCLTGTPVNANPATAATAAANTDPNAALGSAIAGVMGNAPMPASAPNTAAMGTSATASPTGQRARVGTPIEQVTDDGTGAILDLSDTYAAIAEAEAIEAAKAAREEQQRAESQHVVVTRAYDRRTADSSTPKLDRDYLIDSATLAAIQRVIRIADDTGIPQNVGLHGPAGSGKTTMGIQIGAIRRAPTFIIEAAAKQTADEWYGEAIGVSRETGAVQFRPSHFVTGVETPGAVVVINDVALLQSRTVQNGLNELLDPSTRGTFVEQLGRNVAVAPGVVIIGTWNVGAEYTGASELSAQILDRFRAGALFEVPYPSNGALVHILRARTGVSKSDAERLSALTDWLTNDSDPLPVSTRGLLAAASHIVGGATIGHAIYFTVLGDLSAEERARAYGIVDVKVVDHCRPDELAEEREYWRTPEAGSYVALGDVISFPEAAIEDSSAAVIVADSDSSDSEEDTVSDNGND